MSDVDVCEIDRLKKITIASVADHMVFHVDVLGVFRSHVVDGHINATLRYFP